MLEFSRSVWHGTGVLDFDRARRWMNRTWGWTQDVNTRKELMNQAIRIDILLDDINPHWSYSVKYRDYRIYLLGDQELAFFQLAHASGHGSADFA